MLLANGCCYSMEQVAVSSSEPGAARQVDIKVSYNSDSLFLHWGVVRDQPGYVLY